MFPQTKLLYYKVFGVKQYNCVSDSEVKLFDVMKEAGVLPNLADVIARTKEGHLSRMQTLGNSMNGKSSISEISGSWVACKHDCLWGKKEGKRVDSRWTL